MNRTPKTRLVLALTLSLSSMIFLQACQRSSAYKRDENYYREDSSSYYNRASGANAGTKKVESMGQPKKRIVVFNFWNDTPVKDTELGSFTADEMRRGLHLSQRMIVPKDVITNFATDDFIKGDKVKVAQLIREGRRMGVSVLVIGRISKIAFRQRGDDVGLFRQKQSMAAVDVELKLFDVAAGREIMATGKPGQAVSNSNVAIEDSNLESTQFRSELTKLAVRNAVSSILPDVVKAVEKMTWEGHLAKVVGNKIYVNAGKASGLVAGDILKVLSPGDDVYDPVTGAFLGRSQGQLKGTLEVVDFIGTDGAVGEIHTGGNFQEGDVIQLY